ncbi:MAG: hypothetical protein WC975_05990 [Phycisphaerae bacterium]
MNSKKGLSGYKNVKVGILALILCLSSLPWISGCGSNLGENNSLTETLNAVSAKAASIPVPTAAGDYKAYLQTIADFMSSQNQFTQVGVLEDSGCVWGELKNGWSYIFVSNLFPSQAASKEISTAIAKSQASGSTRKAWYELTEMPSVPKVYMCNCLESDYIDITPTLREWFVQKGYSIQQRLYPSGSVEDLKHCSEAGVIYIGSHGGAGSNPGAGSLLSILTNTVVNDENMALYKDDLDDKSLTIMDTRGSHSGPRYGFSFNFIKKYMKFSPNSLVYFDTCMSEGFSNTCLNAGASLFYGWTTSIADTFCSRASKFTFDRLLGINSFPDEVKPELKARPFDCMHVQSQLVAREWSFTQANWGGLTEITYTYDADNGSCGYLAPSIQCLYVNENPPNAKINTSELRIYGVFGSDPGENSRSVTIEGIPLKVTTWTPTKITCEIANSGLGSAGKVTVTNAGRPSNAVPLTEWLVNIKYRYVPAQVTGADTRDTDSLYDQIDLTLRFRYDVHGYLPALATYSFNHFPPDYNTLNPTLNVLNSASFGAWESGGSYYNYEMVNHYADDPPYEALEVVGIPYTWGGSGNLSFENLSQSTWYMAVDNITTSPSAKAYAPDGLIIVDKRPLRFHVVLNVSAEGKTSTEILGPSDLIPPPTPFVTELPVGFTNREVDLVLDDKYYIKPGKVENNGFSLEWTWGSPRFAPDNETAH